ncbi:MAG: uracil-DNA glycosylase [Chloroflexota bacterium]|nr:uracil-DNA glycosylase [Chloroflexota bacterium]
MSELTDLYKQIVVCTNCELHRTRVKGVPGEGPENANIMFIGEGPGFNENQQGRPFVGAAGQFLEALLKSIGRKRSDVYICNVVKCRPPDNRDPLPAEIGACKHYLDRQIALIKPKLIVTLGRFSMAPYFPGESISKVHGQARKRGDQVVVAMFHPAAALHQPKYKTEIEADFKKLPQYLDSLTQPEDRKETKVANPEQLSLF